MVKEYGISLGMQLLIPILIAIVVFAMLFISKDKGLSFLMAGFALVGTGLVILGLNVSDMFGDIFLSVGIGISLGLAVRLFVDIF